MLGVLALNVGLMVAATGVVALAVYTSGAAPEMLGPFRAASYARPFLIVALPNAVIGAALLYVAALLSRRAVASYVVGAVLFVGVFFHLGITAEGLWGCTGSRRTWTRWASSRGPSTAGR